MPVILNEKKESEKIIITGDIGDKPTYTLGLLSKYYRQVEKLGVKSTIDKLNNFMKDNYKGYVSALWENTIENIAKNGNKYSLREIDSIKITKSEIEYIRKLNNIKYEKVLFVILCYAKFHNLNSDNNNNWCNCKISEIFKQSRVNVKRSEEKMFILHDILYNDIKYKYPDENGEIKYSPLVSMSSKNTNLNIKVNFIDDVDECVMSITDFRELGYQYLNYIGEGDFVKCKECGIFVRKTSKKDHSTKYCKDCADKIKNKKTKECVKKTRMKMLEKQNA